MAPTVVEIETPHGLARAHLHSGTQAEGRTRTRTRRRRRSRSARSGDGARRCAREGLTVALVEQPYRVAGRRSPAPATQLDAAWTAVVEALTESHLSGLALSSAAARREPGSRAAPQRRPRPSASSASRSHSCRLGERGADESATGARCRKRPDARGPGRRRSLRSPSGGSWPDRRGGSGRPQPALRSRRDRCRCPGLAGRGRP